MCQASLSDSECIPGSFAGDLFALCLCDRGQVGHVYVNNVSRGHSDSEYVRATFFYDQGHSLATQCIHIKVVDQQGKEDSNYNMTRGGSYTSQEQPSRVQFAMENLLPYSASEVSIHNGFISC
jgi:hypothetical protein